MPRDTLPAGEWLRRLTRLLPQSRLADRAAVYRRLSEIQARPGGGQTRLPSERLLASLVRRLEESAREARARIDRKPSVSFPPGLPITSKAEEIIEAVRTERILIISGETGCGKSTQLPKMCLAAGRGIYGQIACTQPRRIAATTIAHRIAEELGEPVGRSVGYKIRFQEQSSPDAFIKVMTDGMLLAESQSDPRLYDYDTLIIDEAHERSLNIDFLLGITKALLPLRPELKLIITSATLDTEKFVAAFGGARLIQVSGRMYPVEIEYRPGPAPQGQEEVDYVDLAVKAVHRIKKHRPTGDILVFMPTEQDILETCDQLEGKGYAGTSILPLFARLPSHQQRRIYTVKGRKIVVATNVAETSLTIPGIRYVVDTGLARIARYIPETRTNSLPVSAVSQSSADQRTGRCGRVQEGLCIRLFSEEDYQARPRFSVPEILRANLAEVILRMIDLKLGHPGRFPFVDRPKPKAVKDGYDTLVELGAIHKKDRDVSLTTRGRIMARMPLDPKISRMLLEAKKEGCLGEISVIAAALSVRDPRERPPDKQEMADRMHAPFKHPDSDFLTLLNIWNRYHDRWEKLDTQRKKRTFCRDHFLSFLRMREWVLVHGQIQELLKEFGLLSADGGIPALTPERYEAVHRAILSGYLSNIAVHKDKHMYLAAKDRETMLFPGSTLFGKSPTWIVAAEMVKTSRLFARTTAKIRPNWIEDIAGDLCRHSYLDPSWDRSRGEVCAFERVTLYGLEIVSRRRVSYGKRFPAEAHEIFVRSALIQGELKTSRGFLKHNLDLRKKVELMEAKLRRRDLFLGEDILFEFYSSRLPGVMDAQGLESRIEAVGGDEFLQMEEILMIRQIAPADELDGYPDEVVIGGQKLKVDYVLDPAADNDGITLSIPAPLAPHIPPDALDWSISGILKDRIAAMVKGLPKRFRKLLVPVGQASDLLARTVEPGKASLNEALSEAVRKIFKQDIPPKVWAEIEIPKHLRIRWALLDLRGHELAAGRDFARLRSRDFPAPDPAGLPDWLNAQKRWEKSGLTTWDTEDLPESLMIDPHLKAHPGFEVEGDRVNLRLFTDLETALDAHKRGVQLLLRLRAKKDIEYIRKHLILPDSLHSAALHFGGAKRLEDGLHRCLLREVLNRNIRTKKEFESYAANLWRSLVERGHMLFSAAVSILEARQKTRGILQAPSAGQSKTGLVRSSAAAIAKDLEELLPKNFLDVYSIERLQQMPRYIEAAGLRAQRARLSPDKDRKKSEEAERFIAALTRLKSNLPEKPSRSLLAALDEFRWMIEEYKVSLFAPELKTAGPVSSKRLTAKFKEVLALRAGSDRA